MKLLKYKGSFLKSVSFLLFILIFSNSTAFSRIAGSRYYPPRSGEWKYVSPSEFGINAQKLKAAIEFAKSNEYSGSKDLRIAILKAFKREPYIKITGPTKERGGPAGIILKKGYIISKWGDTKRVDMTFSVTKSYLSTVAGLAIDSGLIKSLDDRVDKYVWDGTFEGEHNSEVTWRVLLNQSSDWSGELFKKKDWADRPPKEGEIDDWKRRKLHIPGTFFKYNDVRVNLLAYSLLQVWRKPLPVVLKEKIMDPIGASTTWRWFGYSTSWVVMDGLKIQSVSGGGHSGGGIFINTLDQARFGLLFQREGIWNHKRLLSKKWINEVREPSPANESYGFMWWLNRGKRRYKDVPDHIFYAAGFGGNYIVVDIKNKIVIATRWLEPSKFGAFLKLFYLSLGNPVSGTKSP